MIRKNLEIIETARGLEDVWRRDAYEEHRACHQADKVDDNEDGNVDEHGMEYPHKHPQLRQREAPDQVTY